MHLPSCQQLPHRHLPAAPAFFPQQQSLPQQGEVAPHDSFPAHKNLPADFWLISVQDVGLKKRMQIE